MGEISAEVERFVCFVSGPEPEAQSGAAMPLTNAQVNAFIDAIRRQRDCYARMTEMAQLQIELLEKGDTQGIQFLLVKKQELLDEIEAVEARVKPIKQKWDEVRNHLDPADLAEAEQALVEVRDTLGQLIQLEDEWKSQVESRQGQARERLNKLAQGRRMNQAYGARNPQAPRYMDDKQ